MIPNSSDCCIGDGSAVARISADFRIALDPRQRNGLQNRYVLP
jgi:hypothetical protein